MLYKTHFQRHRYPSCNIITRYRVYSSHACITTDIQNAFVTSLLKKPINHPTYTLPGHFDFYNYAIHLFAMKVYDLESSSTTYSCCKKIILIDEYIIYETYSKRLKLYTGWSSI